MLHCITNSRILKASLDESPKEDHDHIIKIEFDNMCKRFGLNEFEMIAFVREQNIELLNDHYDTIWESLNYYSMSFMDDYKTAYIEWLYDNNLNDPRIESLCDDLKEYIKQDTCINVNNDACTTLNIACKRHHDHCVKYLLNNPDKHDSTKDFAKCNYYYSIQLVPYCCLDDNRNIVDFICMCGGSLDVIKYLFTKLHKKCSTTTINEACKNNRLDIVKYLIGDLHEECPTDAVNLACEYGHLDIVKYLFEEQHKDCTSNAIDIASRIGHFEIVKYLFEVQHKDCTINAIECAIWEDHFDIIKYLFEVQHKDCTDYMINISNCAEIREYLMEIKKQKQIAICNNT